MLQKRNLLEGDIPHKGKTYRPLKKPTLFWAISPKKGKPTAEAQHHLVKKPKTKN